MFVIRSTQICTHTGDAGVRACVPLLLSPEPEKFTTLYHRLWIGNEDPHFNMLSGLHTQVTMRVSMKLSHFGLYAVLSGGPASRELIGRVPGGADHLAVTDIREDRICSIAHLRAAKASFFR